MSSEVMTGASRSAGIPPVWTSVLAVIAHPDDESFGLGVVLDAFIIAGARVEVLCLSHGEAWTLPAAPGDLAALRGGCAGPWRPMCSAGPARRCTSNRRGP